MGLWVFQIELEMKEQKIYIPKTRNAINEARMEDGGEEEKHIKSIIKT